MYNNPSSHVRKRVWKELGVNKAIKWKITVKLKFEYNVAIKNGFDDMEMTPTTLGRERSGVAAEGSDREITPFIRSE